VFFINAIDKVSLEITDKCNLRCKYCYHFTGPGNVNKDLPLQEWLTFLKELPECGATNVTLGGGEPFLRDDLKEIITGVVENSLRFSMVSNGSLITDDIAKFIASTKKCDFIQISVDGSTPEIHDSCRGQGSFEGAVRGIKILQKHKIPITVRVTIHHQNVHDLENIAKFLLEDLKIPNFSTNSVGYIGLCRKNANQTQLTTQDRMYAMQKLLELNKKYGKRVTSKAGPLTEAKIWLKMETAKKEGKQNPKSGCLGTCTGILKSLSVRADGIIVPCSQMSHIELGLINQDSLLDVWYKHSELIRLRERNQKSLSDFESCKNCDYVKYCCGGCPAMAYYTEERDDCIAPSFCLKKFLEDGGKLPKAP
jgi:SynChlorMet cassette radical SAM/SPASM protein ScmE